MVCLLYELLLQLLQPCLNVVRQEGVGADHGLGDDHVDVQGHAFVNHAVELVTLFGVGTGNAVIYVNAIFDTREIPNKQGLSAVLLRRKPSFLCPFSVFQRLCP